MRVQSVASITAAHVCATEIHALCVIVLRVLATKKTFMLRLLAAMKAMILCVHNMFIACSYHTQTSCVQIHAIYIYIYIYSCSCTIRLEGCHFDSFISDSFHIYGFLSDSYTPHRRRILQYLSPTHRC